MRSSSKILERRWRDKQHQLHMDKVRNAKSALRTTFFSESSYRPSETTRQAWKTSAQERKLTIITCYCSERHKHIERENQVLLEKMSQIMQDQRPHLYNPGKSALTEPCSPLQDPKFEQHPAQAGHGQD